MIVYVVTFGWNTNQDDYGSRVKVKTFLNNYYEKQNKLKKNGNYYAIPFFEKIIIFYCSSV